MVISLLVPFLFGRLPSSIVSESEYSFVISPSEIQKRDMYFKLPI